METPVAMRGGRSDAGMANHDRSAAKPESPRGTEASGEAAGPEIQGGESP